MRGKYAACPFHADPCFAHVRRSDSCKALENTDFKKMWLGCPFFKEKDKVDKKTLELGEEDDDIVEDEEGDIIVRMAR